MQPNPFLAFPIQSIHFSSNIIWIIFGLFFCFYAVMSIILSYHWHAYGMTSAKVISMEILFYAVSILLFIIAGVGIAAI